jgi:hypothetical protein
MGGCWKEAIEFNNEYSDLFRAHNLSFVVLVQNKQQMRNTALRQETKALSQIHIT